MKRKKVKVFNIVSYNFKFFKSILLFLWNFESWRVVLWLFYYLRILDFELINFGNSVFVVGNNLVLVIFNRRELYILIYKY